MFRPEGCVIARAKQVKGKLIEGADHEYYQIREQILEMQWGFQGIILLYLIDVENI